MDVYMIRYKRKTYIIMGIVGIVSMSSHSIGELNGENKCAIQWILMKGSMNVSIQSSSQYIISGSDG
jgi:hypothetical protein